MKERFQFYVNLKKITFSSLGSRSKKLSDNFPFVFGMLNENAVLMEYIGDSVDLENTVPNLKSMFKGELFKNDPISSSYFKQILFDVLNAVDALHGFKILHNDIKADNFICARDCVKLIDFGKATLSAFPKSYHIQPGSDVAKRYNTFHRHLAHELRNIPGSKQSEITDAYSVGFMFKHLSAIVGCEDVIILGKSMKKQDPKYRLSVKKAVKVLGQLVITAKC